jgi:predicted nuclease of predicted toxin-antitoxin system
VLFLADESFDFAGVRALRIAGYDVLAVAEVARGASDEAVLDLATRNARILLTEDKDFGELYAAKAGSSAGVLLARFPARARDSQTSSVVEAANRLGSQLHGSFVVVQPGRIRRMVIAGQS